MRSDNTYLKLVLMLCLAGILVSGYLLSIHIRFTTGQASLTETCSILPGNTGCASVAVSDYSDVAGVPIAALAMSFYVAVLLLSFWAMLNHQAANEPVYVSFFLSTIAIVVTVAMFVISHFVLKQFCPFCAMLWLINLALWPCLVKQLGLQWGNALAANLELFRPQRITLHRSRLLGSLGFSFGCLLVFSVVGLAAKSQERQQSHAGESSLVADFQSAPVVMLPPEAYGGPQSKGMHNGGVPLLEIAELADFQCPGCRMASQFLKPFLLKHGDKVRLTFHHFPLDGSCNPYAPNGRHAVACAAARATFCAGKQGKFWELHDQVYDHQEELSLSFLEEIAQKVGLNAADYQACLKDPATETQLQKEMQLGEQVGLESTPTMIINGRKLMGARSPAELEALLEHWEKTARP